MLLKMSIVCQTLSFVFFWTKQMPFSHVYIVYLVIGLGEKKNGHIMMVSCQRHGEDIFLTVSFPPLNN